MGGMFEGLFNVIGAAASEQPRIEAAAANEKEAWASSELAGYAASDALKQGEQEAGSIRMKGAEMSARQYLAYTASGIEGASGTAAQVTQGTMLWTELDAQTAKNNAIRKSLGFKEAERKYARQAGAILAKEQADKTENMWRMLGGAGKMIGSGISAGMGMG